MKKYQMKEFIEDYYMPLKEKTEYRLHDEDSMKRAGNNYQRDYSRILYSASFRRLQGKMQLLGVKSDTFYRNRLTHSFEVAQISRGIAERIQKESGLLDVYVDDIYVVEAGALAHDIGNPPFGHHGEKVLNSLMKDRGGYEGNAQSFRVLNNLEKKLPSVRGLNLTLRTLLSIVKYYKTDQHVNNKFIYREDFNLIQTELIDLKVNPRTIDVQIVDLADEIAYAAHDLEDALSMKLFDIDEFMYEFKDDNKDTLSQLVDKAKKVANSGEVYNSSEEYGFLFRKELISNLVHKLILDIDVIEVDEDERKKTGSLNKYELNFKTYKSFVKNLKQFTFKNINRTSAVQLYEKQGEKIIKGIFDALIDPKFNKDNLLLPVEFRSDESKNKHRNISDFISGMMDSYAFNYFRKLYGDSEADNMYNIDYFGNYTPKIFE